MSDILLYAAVKEKERLDILESASSGGGLGLADFATPAGPSKTPGIGSGASALNPQFVTDWETNLKPLAAPRAQGFRVCDTSGYFRCGQDCTFCVPPSVDKVLFQMWAPGGGTSTNCCCGGAPFGPSGAFYMTELTVCPGECFCLRAGCAYCCYAYQTTPGGDSESTCVYSMSNSNTCIRVMAGYSCFPTWNSDWTSTGTGFGTQTGGGQTCSIPTDDNCSPNMCSGWNFCWDSGDDDVTVPHLFSSCAWCHDEPGTSVKNFGYGIPSIWPSFKIPGTNLNTAESVSPPVFGFESLTCKDTWSQGQTCSGCCRCAQQGFQQGPSFGGYATQVFGGCQACGGDAGGMGMICISYNCN